MGKILNLDSDTLQSYSSHTVTDTLFFGCATDLTQCKQKRTWLIRPNQIASDAVTPGETKNGVIATLGASVAAGEMAPRCLPSSTAVNPTPPGRAMHQQHLALFQLKRLSLTKSRTSCTEYTTFLR